MAKKKIYRFTGKEGGFVSEALLKKWIQQHEDHHAVKAHFYGKEILTKILNRPGCMGIRIYYGIDDSAKKQLILIGADEKGKDLWPSSSTGKLKGTNVDGADQGVPCPPWCS